MAENKDTVSDFDNAPETLVDGSKEWNARLSNFHARDELHTRGWPCIDHQDAETPTCDVCEVVRCGECLDICPCMAMEQRGIYLSFGNITRCCFCGIIWMRKGDPPLVHARSAWGDAYGHSGCIMIRAERLRGRLDVVLAKPDPLPDVFALIFDQVMHPSVFEEIDKDRVQQWCNEQSTLTE